MECYQIEPFIHHLTSPKWYAGRFKVVKAFSVSRAKRTDAGEAPDRILLTCANRKEYHSTHFSLVSTAIENCQIEMTMLESKTWLNLISSLVGRMSADLIKTKFELQRFTSIN